MGQKTQARLSFGSLSYSRCNIGPLCHNLTDGLRSIFEKKKKKKKGFHSPLTKTPKHIKSRPLNSTSLIARPSKRNALEEEKRGCARDESDRENFLPSSTPPKEPPHLTFFPFPPLLPRGLPAPFASSSPAACLASAFSSTSSIQS